MFGDEEALQMAILLCFGRLGEVRFFSFVQPTGDRRTTSLMSTGATVRGRLQLCPRSAVLRHFPVRGASFQPSGGLSSADGFHSLQFCWKLKPTLLFSTSVHAGGPPPVSALALAVCRIRITLRRRKEPREILSRPLT